MTRDQRQGGRGRRGKGKPPTPDIVEPHSPAPPEAVEASALPDDRAARPLPPGSIDFEWDEEKAEINLRKHGVPFEEARTIFGDPRTLTVPDRQHSQEEDRSITLGTSAAGHVLIVVHRDRGRKIRLISARRASPGERRKYEEG